MRASVAVREAGRGPPVSPSPHDGRGIVSCTPAEAHEDVPSIEVKGLTRGAFLVRGTLAAAAAYGAEALNPFVSEALAQEARTEGPALDYVLILQYLESAAYEAALTEIGDLTPEGRSLLRLLAENERRHVDVLREAITASGEAPSKPPKFAFGEALADQEAFLELAQRIEDTVVYALNGAVANAKSERLLSLLAATVQVDARHAAAIRQERGFPIVESAFDRAWRRETALNRVDDLILS